MFFFFLLILRPPRSTRTVTRFPYTTLVRSAGVQFGAIGGVGNDARLGVLKAHPCQIMASTLQIEGLFAIQLQEGAGVLQHFVVRLHLHEELGHFGLDAAVAAHIQLPARVHRDDADVLDRSEEHTSELQSLMRNSYAVFCLKKKKTK